MGCIPNTEIGYESDDSREPQEFIDLEEKFGCHNYHPIPVVLAKAKGIYV